ncbi:MAG: prolyl oligopeptidase family serine peptidase [Blastocatellia bacterium]
MLKPPPSTRLDNIVEVIHGLAIPDPYRWLENTDSPETRNWIDAQNRYTESILGALPERESVRKQLEELLRVDTISPPTVRGNNYFFFKRNVGQDQSSIYMKNRLTGEEIALIDPNRLSEDQSTWVSLLDISQDGRIMACGVREGGEDEMSVAFFNTELRKEIQGRLPKAVYSSISLEPDGGGVYYSRLLENGPRVYYRSIEKEGINDIEIFGEGYGSEQRIRAHLSSDGKYLMLSVLHGSSASKVEVYSKDVKNHGPINVVISGIDASFLGRIEDEYMFVRTDWQAPNGRILRINLREISPDNWCEIIPETDSVIIEFSLVGKKLFVSYLMQVTSQIKVFDTSGNYIRSLSFPSMGIADGMWGDWNFDEAFYIFSSFAHPPTIYCYHISTGTQEVWSYPSASISSDQIEVKQIWYESKDSTLVPMFVVHKRQIKLDGERPTLLMGYGGFGISMKPNYSTRAAFWVENGGVFALPNLRGGGEFGQSWHREGVLEKKQNVFDDFIAGAEWLINNSYTNPTKLAIYGNSNGGLLVGAAVTQRPDLFQAVVCSHPLLDMIRYHRFLSARSWLLEYGCSEKPDQFKYLYSYSPYHQVKQRRKYPSVLIITGDADTRVSPIHALKMTASMQSTDLSDSVVLLLYTAKAGHSGGAPISRYLENLTDEMAFLFWQLRFVGD